MLSNLNRPTSDCHQSTIILSIYRFRLKRTAVCGVESLNMNPQYPIPVLRIYITRNIKRGLCIVIAFFLLLAGLNHYYRKSLRRGFKDILYTAFISRGVRYSLYRYPNFQGLKYTVNKSVISWYFDSPLKSRI